MIVFVLHTNELVSKGKTHYFESMVVYKTWKITNLFLQELLAWVIFYLFLQDFNNDIDMTHFLFVTIFLFYFYYAESWSRRTK